MRWEGGFTVVTACTLSLEPLARVSIATATPRAVVDVTWLGASWRVSMLLALRACYARAGLAD